METIKHFSHEHTLEPVTPQKDEVCYGCGNLVYHYLSKETMYSCSNCKLFLHRDCANLPSEINHPIHPEHPLILHANPVYSCDCVVCSYPCERFTYHCSPCKFDLCVKSAFLVFQDRKIKHDCHQHMLTLMQRPARFWCDACDCENKTDLSYACDICPFWIHKNCASLPRAAEYDHHPHHLSLAYHLPVAFLRYHFTCDVCHEILKRSDWVYYCRPCRYFVHLRCFKSGNSRLQRISSGHSSRSYTSLPWTNMSLEVVTPFVIDKTGILNIKTSPEINHFSHEHPLKLSSQVLENDNNDEEILCDACIEPISTPYYSCVECSFLLHSSCAYLPATLKHPMHPGHELTLKKPKMEFGYFYCSICLMTSNGFFFECEPCNFKLHLHCAIFACTVAHDGHYLHHLCLKPLVFVGLLGLCGACGAMMDGFGYYCSGRKPSGALAFNLHYQCSILPRTVRHRWDEHVLTLQLQPNSHSPDEFYCEICEEEIHPKRWLYRCDECDQSFHPLCIPRLGKDRFMKFGSTIKVEQHEHLLTSVRECRFVSSCSSCGVNLYGHKGFQCELPCTFCLCYGCACEVPPKKDKVE